MKKRSEYEVHVAMKRRVHENLKRLSKLNGIPFGIMLTDILDEYCEREENRKLLKSVEHFKYRF